MTVEFHLIFTLNRNIYNLFTLLHCLIDISPNKKPKSNSDKRVTDYDYKEDYVREYY